MVLVSERLFKIFWSDDLGDRVVCAIRSLSNQECTNGEVHERIRIPSSARHISGLLSTLEYVLITDIANSN